MNPLQYLVAESTYEKNADLDNEYFGGPPGGPVPCGGGDNGSYGTPD